MIRKYNENTVITPAEKLYKLATFIDDSLVLKDTTGRQMSGYVSTGSADLVNDSIPPQAYTKHLHRYLKNPVYCFMHDHFSPIGQVKNTFIDETGLYLEDITLSDIPLVRDILWPMIKDGTLRQQSVGFLSLAGHYVKDIYVHDEVYLLESSLVTVACNPEAMLDQVKALRKAMPNIDQMYDFSNPQKFLEDYYLGHVPLISDVSKTVSMYTPAPKEEVETTMPTIDKTVMATATTRQHDPEGAIAKMPQSFSKSYEEVADAVYAMKRIVDGKPNYMLPMGVATESGVKYVFELVAVSMAKLFGARGDLNLSAEEKSDICTRLAEGYTALGKEIPVYEETAVNDLAPDVLATLKFNDIKFANDEKGMFEMSVVENSLEAIHNIAKNWASREKAPAGSLELIRKWTYATFEVYVSINDAEDVDLVGRVMAALLDPVDPAEVADTIPSAFDADAPEGVEKAEPETQTAGLSAESKALLQQFVALNSTKR